MHIFVFLVHILAVLRAYLHAYFVVFKCINNYSKPSYKLDYKNIFKLYKIRIRARSIKFRKNKKIKLNSFQIVKMLVVLILIFGICWLPYHAYFIYANHNPEVMQMDNIQVNLFNQTVPKSLTILQPKMFFSAFIKSSSFLVRS